MPISGALFGQLLASIAGYFVSRRAYRASLEHPELYPRYRLSKAGRIVSFAPLAPVVVYIGIVLMLVLCWADFKPRQSHGCPNCESMFRMSVTPTTPSPLRSATQTRCRSRPGQHIVDGDDAVAIKVARAGAGYSQLPSSRWRLGCSSWRRDPCSPGCRGCRSRADIVEGQATS